MPTPRHVPARAARDRVIDLLGFGETYPLQDVEVQEEQLTVRFDQPAAFEIRPGQTDVRYELHEAGAPVVPPCTADGTGAATVLPGPVITADKTFRIRASKIDRPSRAAFLHDAATVKVGLDAGLRAWIHSVPPLHSDHPSPADTDPRLADHGGVVEVRVARGQPGATYELVYRGAGGDEITLSDPAVSTAGDLSFFTPPVERDTLFRIRVARRFDPTEGREDLEAWLKAELPLAVRADPSPAVAIDGSPFVDPTTPVSIPIPADQEGVAYSAHVRPLRDADFAFDAPLPGDVLSVSVPSSLDAPAHDVHVRAPHRPSPYEVPPGYTPHGAPSAGTGAGVTLVLPALHDDSLLLIQARKAHFPTGTIEGRPVRSGQSTTVLDRALVALPRPDPALTLTLTPASGEGSDALLVSGGQPGVFYHVRRDAQGEPIGLPAYFHRRDEDDPQQNRGLGHLRIGMDLAVARAPSPPPAAPAEYSHPPDPLVEVTRLPGGEVSVMAVHARTGVAWIEPRPFPVEGPR